MLLTPKPRVEPTWKRQLTVKNVAIALPVILPIIAAMFIAGHFATDPDATSNWRLPYIASLSVIAVSGLWVVLSFLGIPLSAGAAFAMADIEDRTIENASTFERTRKLFFVTLTIGTAASLVALALLSKLTKSPFLALLFMLPLASILVGIPSAIRRHGWKRILSQYLVPAFLTVGFWINSTFAATKFSQALAIRNGWNWSNNLMPWFDLIGMLSCFALASLIYSHRRFVGAILVATAFLVWFVIQDPRDFFALPFASVETPHATTHNGLTFQSKGAHNGG